MTVSVQRELSGWTVRVNGVWIGSFWRRGRAYELAHRLAIAGDREDIRRLALLNGENK